MLVNKKVYNVDHVYNPYIGALQTSLASPSLLRTTQPPLAAVEGRQVRELRRVGKRIAIGVEGYPWLI